LNTDKHLQNLTFLPLNTDRVSDMVCYYVYIVSKQGDMTKKST